MNKNKIVIFAIVFIVILLLAFFIFEQMGTNQDIELLDKKIKRIDFAALMALAITLVLGILSFIYKGKQNNLLKRQREIDQLNIAKSNEKSEEAKKEAAIANASAAASDERSALAKKEAAIAYENANESGAKAEEARKEAAIANANIAMAKERAESAKKEAAISNEKAAKAELKSKETELQLLKLRLAVAPRYVPDFVKDNLKNELRKYPHKKVTIVCAVSNDSEPILFAESLDTFFKSLGWESNIMNQQNIRIPAPIGFTIIGFGDANKSIANYIYNQFSELNYECAVLIDKPNKIDLVIQIWGKQ